MKIRRSMAVTLTTLALAVPAMATHHEDASAKGREKAEEASAKGRERAGAARARGTDAVEETEAQGDAMKDRRDERKAIMDQTKGAAEPGTPQKGKKPWWRFWGSDE